MKARKPETAIIDRPREEEKLAHILTGSLVALLLPARRCAAEKGEDDESCKFFAKAYRSLCPTEWVEKWNEERDGGTFAGRY